MVIQKALIKINREYEGIDFLYNDFADENPLSLISNLHIGTHQSPFLKITTLDHRTSIQYMADNSNSNVIFVAMVCIEGKVDHSRLLNTLFYFEDQIRFDVSIASTEEVFQKLSRFKGLERLFYAILSKKQIVILSDQEIKVRIFVLELLSILPPLIIRNRTFLTYADNYRSDIDILGITNSQNNPIEFTERSTIVLLEDRTVLGSGESEITEKMRDRVQALDMEGYYHLTKEIIDILHHLSHVRINKVYISQKYNLKNSDADLVLSFCESISEVHK